MAGALLSIIRAVVYRVVRGIAGVGTTSAHTVTPVTR